MSRIHRPGTDHASALTSGLRNERSPSAATKGLHGGNYGNHRLRAQSKRTAGAELRHRSLDRRRREMTPAGQVPGGPGEAAGEDPLSHLLAGPTDGDRTRLRAELLALGPHWSVRTAGSRIAESGRPGKWSAWRWSWRITPNSLRLARQNSQRWSGGRLTSGVWPAGRQMLSTPAKTPASGSKSPRTRSPVAMRCVNSCGVPRSHPLSEGIDPGVCRTPMARTVPDEPDA